LYAVLLFTGLTRLLTLGAYPLFDKTEARYAEIAREMAATNNWITPQFDYGTPFWGKPPLSTWVTAFFLKLFGVNEFAARFSSLLFALGIVWLTYRLALSRQHRDYALTVPAILSTSALFFVAGGCVMTDAALSFGTTLAMVSFWLAVRDGANPDRFWGYLFFVGLAIGLLAKGPVAIVLTGLPIVVWVALEKQWECVWRRLPWLTGSLLVIVIALPWYLAAERATPGFLQYFIIGEHLKRFTETGWKGDLYGQGHAHPFGTIWFYWFLATFPWCFVFFGMLLRTGRKIRELLRNEWLLYLALWTVAPMIFFSFTANILWTYVLPGLPAFSLILVELLSADRNSSGCRTHDWQGISISLITPTVFCLGLLFLPSTIVAKKTQKGVIAKYLDLRPALTSKLIYLGKIPYSAEFYSQGTAQTVATPEKLKPYLSDNQENFFVISKRGLLILQKDVKENLSKVGDYGEYQLLVSKNRSGGIVNMALSNPVRLKEF